MKPLNAIAPQRNAPHERHLNCRYAECTSRRRLPPLPSPRPQTGQILDSRRHKRRQGVLALCAPGLPGIPEKWTGAATNKHGDLLDLIRLCTGGASLRRAMEEALAFLSLPPSTPANGGAAEGVQRSWLDPKRPAKANLVRPRKALGRVHGRAVRFGGSASGATLLAGEGIETVLSAGRPPSPVFMPRRLYRRAASAPPKHPKTSLCWSSPAIKMWKVGKPRTVFSAVAWNATFPQS